MYDDQWQDDALCPQVDVDPAIWFPKNGGNGTEAKRICALCDVQEPCLVYAFDLADQHGGHHGVFAGTSASEREQMDDPRGPGQEPQESPEVARIRSMAGLGWNDVEIGRALDKTQGAVGAMRRRHDIPAGQPAAARRPREKAGAGSGVR